MPLLDSIAHHLKGCHLGDTRSQRWIYERYYTYTLHIVLHYASSREEAEEVTQDAFFNVFKRLRKELLSGDFKAYLARTAVNASIDRLRSQRCLPKTDMLTEASVTKLVGPPNAGERILAEAEIHLLLRQLAPSYRGVFNLFFLEGFTHSEIAEQLNISVGTSKSNLSYAKKRLRTLAGPFFQLPDITKT